MNGVVPEYEHEDNSDVKKVTMKVLKYERECSLAAILVPAGFTDGACRRIEKERAIVSLAVVVTGGAETQRRPENENGRREWPPTRFDEWRIEWRKVWAPFVVLAFESSPGCVDAERAEDEHDGEEFEPPRIATHRRAETTTLQCGSRFSHRLTPLAEPVFSRKGAKTQRKLRNPLRLCAFAGKDPNQLRALNYDALLAAVSGCAAGLFGCGVIRRYGF